jgi:hypothetical protein
VDADAQDGVLVYIKASLNSNEPPDVANYAATNVDFPHQTTGDQFFDEAQFESYRRLGSHIVEEICGPGRVAFSVTDLVRQVREHYLKPAAKAAQQG